MRGALEGLPAHRADVDALPAVHLLAVVQQQGGRGEGAATLQALVQPALLLGLPTLGQVRRHVRHLEQVTNPGLTGPARGVQAAPPRTQPPSSAVICGRRPASRPPVGAAATSSSGVPRAAQACLKHADWAGSGKQSAAPAGTPAADPAPRSLVVAAAGEVLTPRLYFSAKFQEFLGLYMWNSVIYYVFVHPHPRCQTAFKKKD